MIYQLTGIDTHLDFGFGITGEAYYESAEYLFSNKESIKVVQLGEMPINYLYRHSIELFIKSLIIISHKKLQIAYDSEPFDSVRPKILTGGIWKDLYTCHWLDELYNYWLNELLLRHKDALESIAPRGDWQESNSISEFFPLIASYDRDSSFFRYPVTRNAALDPEKFTMQHIDLEKLQQIFKGEDTRKNGIGSQLFLLYRNDDGNIIDGFERTDDVLEDITQALKEVAHYFYCIHAMARMTLCEGY